MAHNSHPLRGNHVHRGMKIEVRCVVCNSVGEDGGHLFFKCRLEQQVWSLLYIEDERSELATFQCPRAAVEYILGRPEDQKMLIIIALWNIWNERNGIREEGRWQGAEYIARSRKAYAAEAASLLKGAANTNAGGAGTRRERWSKPHLGCLKLNCNDSFLPQAKSGSWGFLIRDSDGDVVTAGRGKIHHVLKAFHAELIACLHEIQTAIDLGIGQLIVEMDSLMVARAINYSDFDEAAAGHLVGEIKSLVLASFISFGCLF